ncbi:PPE family protein [Mycobacterium sp.]|uniref:PPE family protein n=1 Tax=Mycobacterium sp. TaxID=1785 RepID=UPI0025F6247E|nr:PPE family protein [Mycobacterium sp.]
MIDFGAIPPEINSARMYAGPGAGSLAAAAAAWDGLAAEVHAAAGFYRSAVAGLITGRWLGPASLSMASALGPYMAWTAGVAARAAETASQAMLAVEAYEAAFAATVPPPAVIANRVQLAALVATNFFGQNSPAIAATEAAYGEMWAQDAVAMYEYAAHSAAASALTPFGSPPEVVNPAGVAGQAAAAAKSAAAAGTQHLSLAGVVSAVPAALQGLASPLATPAANLSSLTSFLLTPTGISLASVPVYAIPSYFTAAATPLYSMASIFGIAQSGQAIEIAAATPAAAAGAAGAAAEGAAAEGAAAGAATAASLASSVTAGAGNAASLGPLSVPASWTSVIPTAKVSAAAALPDAGLNGANVPPSMLGAAPRGGAAGSSRVPGPRYGMVPTVMTRPPSGGYG